MNPWVREFLEGMLDGFELVWRLLVWLTPALAVLAFFLLIALLLA